MGGRLSEINFLSLRERERERDVILNYDRKIERRLKMRLIKEAFVSFCELLKEAYNSRR